MAFVLALSPNSRAWLADFDKWSRSSPDFFVGRPMVLDLAALAIDRAGIAELIAALGERGMRSSALEGVGAAAADAATPAQGRTPPPVRKAKPGRRQAEGSPRGGLGTSGAHLAADREPYPFPANASVPYGDVHRARLGGRPALRSLPADRSTSTERSVAAPWPDRSGNGRAPVTPQKRSRADLDRRLPGPPRKWTHRLRRATQCWLEDRVLMLAALD